MGEAILVTGASGFLGSRCLDALARQGRPVIGVWRSGTDRIAPASNVRYEQCDLADREAVTRLFSGAAIGTVIHAAALLADGKPDYLHRATLSNVVGTINLADAARAAGCHRFVYCSSISIFVSTPCPPDGWDEDARAEPLHEYGWSKHAGEECVRLRTTGGAMTGISLRLAGIHGPGRRGGVLYNTIAAALAGQPISLTNASTPYQLVFLDDASDALLAASTAALSPGHHRINVASTTFPALRDMATEVITLCGSKSEIREQSAPSPGPQVMNIARTGSLLGWRRVPVEQRMRETIDWVARSGSGR